MLKLFTFDDGLLCPRVNDDLIMGRGVAGQKQKVEETEKHDSRWELPEVGREDVLREEKKERVRMRDLGEKKEKEKKHRN